MSNQDFYQRITVANRLQSGLSQIIPIHNLNRIIANGGQEYDGEESARIGNYNWLLDTCPKDLYDASKETNLSSHQLFRTAFPNGFAWEVIEVYSPPPTVAFSWRHWAEYSGTYKGKQGNGDTVNLTGFAVATVDENVKICSINIYFKPEDFLKVMEGELPAETLTKSCPFGH